MNFIINSVDDYRSGISDEKHYVNLYIKYVISAPREVFVGIKDKVTLLFPLLLVATMNHLLAEVFYLMSTGIIKK